MVDFSFLDSGKYPSSGKINRESLEAGLLSGIKLNDYFEYKYPTNSSKALKRIFPHAEDKISNELWDTYLRRKCGLKVCSHCRKIFKLEEISWWRCKECNLIWQRENPERYKQYKKELYLSQRDTQQYKNIRKAEEAKRRARKLKRTPNWSNLQKIQEIYNNCPKGYHVDHIIPLKGEKVSGLHVEDNLQYLPATENIQKGNKYFD